MAVAITKIKLTTLRLSSLLQTYQVLTKVTPFLLASMHPIAMAASLAYQWIQVSGITIDLQNANTRNVTFDAPEVNNNGSVELRITVTDNQGAPTSATTSFSILDLNNQPPIVSIASGILTISEDETIQIIATATDSDGQIVSYQWSQAFGRRRGYFQD